MERHAARGAPPSKSLLARFPGLDSYLSEVDRFALDIRKRSTVPTDSRYIDARVAESATTGLYVAQTTLESSRPAPPSGPRSHPIHRDDGSMGPSTGISRSRTWAEQRRQYRAT